MYLKSGTGLSFTSAHLPFQLLIVAEYFLFIHFKRITKNSADFFVDFQNFTKIKIFLRKLFHYDHPPTPGSCDHPPTPGSCDHPPIPGSCDHPPTPGSGDHPPSPGSCEVPRKILARSFCHLLDTNKLTNRQENIYTGSCDQKL